MLQKYPAVGVSSSIDSSSHPHLGHRAAGNGENSTWLFGSRCPAASSRSPAAAIVFPASARSPFTSITATPRERLPRLSPQPIHIHPPQPDASVGIDPARPIRFLHVDRREAYTVA